MGLLTGKYTARATLPRDDVRGHGPGLAGVVPRRPAGPEWLRRVAAVRAALTADGRTLAQGALGWIWARSGRTIPIPGCRTVAQVEENAGALGTGARCRRTSSPRWSARAAPALARRRPAATPTCPTLADSARTRAVSAARSGPAVDHAAH